MGSMNAVVPEINANGCRRRKMGSNLAPSPAPFVSSYFQDLLKVQPIYSNCPQTPSQLSFSSHNLKGADVGYPNSRAREGMQHRVTCADSHSQSHTVLRCLQEDHEARNSEDKRYINCAAFRSGMTVV